MMLFIRKTRKDLLCGIFIYILNLKDSNNRVSYRQQQIKFVSGRGHLAIFTITALQLACVNIKKFVTKVQSNIKTTLLRRPTIWIWIGLLNGIPLQAQKELSSVRGDVLILKTFRKPFLVHISTFLDTYSDISSLVFRTVLIFSTCFPLIANRHNSAVRLTSSLRSVPAAFCNLFITLSINSGSKTTSSELLEMINTI